MKNNIIIYGGGVVSILAYMYLIKRGYNVKIKSKELGGSFFSGGLKYLHSTSKVKEFMDILGINYVERKIVGAVYHNGVVYSHPEEVLWECYIHGESYLHNNYLVKIGSEDSRSMNDPFRLEGKDTSIALIPMITESQSSFEEFINFCRTVILKNGDFIQWELDADFDFKPDLEDGAVIWTLPAYLIAGEEKQSFKFKNVLIKRFYSHKDVWWDYCYDTNIDSPTYRISKSNYGIKNFIYDIETFEYNKEAENNLLYRLGFKPNIAEFVDVTFKKIEGTGYKDKDKLPNNFMLLGRYAEWDKRILVSDTIAKVMRNYNG